MGVTCGFKGEREGGRGEGYRAHRCRRLQELACGQPCLQTMTGSPGCCVLAQQHIPSCVLACTHGGTLPTLKTGRGHGSTHRPVVLHDGDDVGVTLTVILASSSRLLCWGCLHSCPHDKSARWPHEHLSCHQLAHGPAWRWLQFPEVTFQPAPSRSHRTADVTYTSVAMTCLKAAGR